MNFCTVRELGCCVIEAGDAMRVEKLIVVFCRLACCVVKRLGWFGVHAAPVAFSLRVCCKRHDLLAAGLRLSEVFFRRSRSVALDLVCWGLFLSACVARGTGPHAKRRGGVERSENAGCREPRSERHRWGGVAREPKNGGRGRPRGGHDGRRRGQWRRAGPLRR